MDTCGKCGREWHSVCDGRVVLPVRVPISTDGASLMVVCTDCSVALSSREIGDIAKTKYIASCKAMPDSPAQLSEATASIEKWVERWRLSYSH